MPVVSFGSGPLTGMSSLATPVTWLNDTISLAVVFAPLT
jgi:hypothetical protein